MSASMRARCRFSSSIWARQVADLPADVALLVGVNGTQLIEFADFGIDLDLFNDGRIARGDCLDFRVGERAALQVLRRAD